MPIMNVFNEWHAANTSKKIRAVWKAKAKEGVFHGKKPLTDISRERMKTNVYNRRRSRSHRKRIFELYASGVCPKDIGNLNGEGVPSPGQYAFEKLGHKGKAGDRRLWGQITISAMLKIWSISDTCHN